MFEININELLIANKNSNKSKTNEEIRKKIFCEATAISDFGNPERQVWLYG